MGELVPASKRLQKIHSLLTSEKMTKSLALAIRMPGVKPAQIVRVAMSMIQRDNNLAECEPLSICAAVVTACQLGLEPDNVSGLAYLVPFNKRCTLIPGYRGLVQLAYRSGQVASFETRVVYEHDDCVVDWGAEPPIVHKPTPRKDRGKTIAVYAKVKLNTGGTVWEWMWQHEVDAIRDRYSHGCKRSDSPWQTEPNAQARKTVARRACKWVPSSPQLQRAVSLDDQAEIGKPQDLEAVDIAVASEPVGPPKTLDEAVDQAEAATKAALPSETMPPGPEPEAVEAVDQKPAGKNHEAVKEFLAFWKRIPEDSRRKMIADPALNLPFKLIDGAGIARKPPAEILRVLGEVEEYVVANEILLLDETCEPATPKS
jgi:recombination protein RecT